MSAERHLILGGQRSGKSRRAEAQAATWLTGPGREAVLVATGLAGDEEMAERIARHRLDRAQRVPGLSTVEEPRAVAAAVRSQSAPHCLVVVDCLTLWLTQLLMPMTGPAIATADLGAAIDDLADAVGSAPGPVVLVSNEIGLGLSPLSREARHFVDELGRVHQRMAEVCDRVTLMVAGLPLTIKAGAEANG